MTKARTGLSPELLTAPSSADLPRTIGFWGALAIMVGIIIGSGIFRTPASIAKELDNPNLILFLWTVGGMISLCGALTYAELAAMFPHSGGVYVFLREGLGPVTAFVFGWTYMLISKPLAAAGIAIIFAENINGLFNVQWDLRVITCVILIVLTAINVRGVRLGSGVALVLTSLKIIALLAIVGLALVLGKETAQNYGGPSRSNHLLNALAPVMYAILWTYDGWSDLGAIAGEVKDPQRKLPRLFLVGTILTTGLYVAVNAAYMAVLPPIEMRDTPNVPSVVMDRLLGPIGGLLVTVVVLVSTLGSTHGSILTGARITFAQARDGLLFRFLSRVHSRYETPAISLWTQLLLSCVAVAFIGNFEDLTAGFMFTMWIFYGLAAIGLFVLRIRRPGADRPYRCWGYPIVPLVFILSSVGMTWLEIRANLNHTLPWIVVLFAGVPVYYVWKKLVRKSRSRDAV